MRVPLRWHPVDRTHSPVEAYTRMVSRYPNVRGFAPLGDEKAFAFGANSIVLDSVRLTAGYSSGFSFSEAEEARLTLGVPLSAGLQLSEGGESARLGRDDVFVSGPSAFAATYGAGFSGLFVTVGLDTMSDYSELDSGRRWAAPPRTRALTRNEAQRLKAVILGCVQVIDAFEADAARFAAKLRLDEQLVRAILITLDPAGNEAALASARDLSDEQIRAAEDFIESHALEAISVADVARALNISVRSLQAAFKRSRRCSPYAYIQERRLHFAHQALLHASPGQTVQSIARAHGFAHLGRFSAMIHALGGQSPSEILRNRPRLKSSEA